MVGLDQAGLGFLTIQDQTPKIAGQILRDWTESGLIFLNILPNKKNWKKKLKNGIFSTFKTLVSGKENIWFPDSLNFENLLDFRTGCDVW